MFYNLFPFNMAQLRFCLANFCPTLIHQIRKRYFGSVHIGLITFQGSSFTLSTCIFLPLPVEIRNFAFLSLLRLLQTILHILCVQRVGRKSSVVQHSKNREGAFILRHHSITASTFERYKVEILCHAVRQRRCTTCATRSFQIYHAFNFSIVRRNCTTNSIRRLF